MRKTLLFFTMLGSAISYAQTSINSFLGQWNQSDGKVLKITSLSNDEGGVKARYDYGVNYYYNPTFPNPDQNNYVVILNTTNNTLTFKYIASYIDYISITQFYYHVYEITTINQNQMILTKSGGGGTLSFNKSALSTSEVTEKKNEISIAQNPVKNDLILKLPQQSKEVYIKIFSIDGKLIKEAKYSKSLNVSDLLKGIYFLEIKNETTTSKIKMIKD